MDLRDRTPIVEETARKLGLYADGSEVVAVPDDDGVSEVLVVSFTVGDVAWRTRTQDQEQAEYDRMAAEMEANMVGTDFVELRNRIEANLAAGRDPLDDGDDGPDAD